jgi:hypothetical protein
MTTTLYVGPGFHGETQWWKKKGNSGNAWEVLTGKRMHSLQWEWISWFREEIEVGGFEKEDFFEYVGISKDTFRGYKSRSLPFHRFCLLANASRHLGQRRKRRR